MFVSTLWWHSSINCIIEAKFFSVRTAKMSVQIVIIIGLKKTIFGEIKIPVFYRTGPSCVEKVKLGNCQCVHARWDQKSMRGS